MSDHRKKLSFDEAREIARLLTREALKKHKITDEFWSQVVLGSGLESDTAIFELYIPGERPEDARLISQTVINRYTGRGEVKIFLE